MISICNHRGLRGWFDNFIPQEHKTLTENPLWDKIFFPNYVSNIQEFVLKNCKLTEQFVHFPKGTIFKEIVFNDCGVVEFNILKENKHFQMDTILSFLLEC